jgi:hypothetical protein
MYTENRPIALPGDDRRVWVLPMSADAQALIHEAMLRRDFIEGVMSFFEKRPPIFPPLSDASSHHGKDHDDGS